MPVALEKCEGSTTCLTFLGIKIDNEALELHLFSDKRSRVRSIVTE